MSERVPGLAAARLWAATRFPYLATGVFGAQVIAAPGSGTVSVDPRWRMRVDPDLGWTPAQLGSVLVHHVCHLLRTHAERAQLAGVGPEQAGTWVRAADAEINDDLVSAGLELPGRPVLPGDFGAEDGQLAEQYFEGLKKAPEPRHASCLGCGSGADGIPRPGDEAGDEAADGVAGLPAWQADLLRRQVAQDVIAHGKQAGDVPLGLLRWAEEILRPTVNWRVVLAAELRRAIAEVSGAVDYSYRRPSRRSSVAGRAVLPALRRPVPEVAVVCDTSGSMTADLLATVLAEVEGLLRALGLARQVRVLACDTAVGPVQRVSSARQVQLVGGGGTDMGAGIAAASALRPRPAVTVVLTDGYTPWPPQAPKGMRVVAGLLGEQAPDAPPWARAVRVDPQDRGRLHPPWKLTRNRSGGCVPASALPFPTCPTRPAPRPWRAAGTATMVHRGRHSGNGGPSLRPARRRGHGSGRRAGAWAWAGEACVSWGAMGHPPWGVLCPR